MFIEGIKFKRNKDSEWENGYYIGENEDSDKSVIIDCNYVPVNKSCGFKSSGGIYIKCND